MTPKRSVLRSLFGAAAVLAPVLIAATAAPAARAADRTLTFLTWNAPQNEPMFRAWIDAFTEANPGVEIEWLDKKGSEWATFYQTQLAAGTPPDIVDVQGTLWAEYAENGYLLDLTPYLEKEPEIRDRFAPRILDYWKLDGKIYGLPYYVNKSLLFWNKLLFEKAGLDGPPRDFDALLADAEKVAALGDEVTGFLSLNFDWLYWPLFAMNGIEMFTPDMKKAAFNTPEAVAVVTRLAELTEAGVINKITWTGRWREPNGAFASGTVGMYQAHGGAYYNFKRMGDWISPETVGAAEFPEGWGVFNSHGFLISAETAHPDLAWAFVKLVTDDEWALGTARRIIRTTGNKSVDAALIGELASTDVVGLDIMTAQGASMDKVTAGWNSPLDTKIKNVFWPELQSALLGQKDPAEALAEAERKINRLLDRGR